MPATPSNEVSHLQAELHRDTGHLRQAWDTHLSLNGRNDSVGRWDSFILFISYIYLHVHDLLRGLCCLYIQSF